jgi:ribosome maturation factor RimP
MPVYSDKFLLTQIGRGVAVHFDQPRWQTGRHKRRTTHGLLAGVEGRMLVVKVHGEEYPVRVEVDADQPAFATRDGIWWEWTSPQRPLPPGFQDE